MGGLDELAPRFSLRKANLQIDSIGESVCLIARSLAVVSDRWMMLLVRELFMGTRRFDEIRAQTAMSPHLLSIRLKRLEEDGVIVREPYQDRPLRHEYRLTPKGKELYAVILSLRAWGTKWCRCDGSAAPAVNVVHLSCGEEVGSGTIHSTTCTTTAGLPGQTASERSCYLSRQSSCNACYAR
jgi:DNA-binding HxlR family transcriptional regulator